MKNEIVGQGGITAKVIEDSISEAGKRITTMQLTYPRFILAEFNTHRVFSRNSASSRAIPVKKIIEQVRNNPAMPIHWGKNKPGMQAKEELGFQGKERMKALWLMAAEEAALLAEDMMEEGCHKQVVNRILEPYQFMHTIVTSTEWDNFFLLRDHPDAQPEIQELAKCMRKAMEQSEPKVLVDDWHLPYVREDEKTSLTLNEQLCVSTARCCRVSYNKHDGAPATLGEDIELHNRLLVSIPMHSSPGEHQARPVLKDYTDASLTGNFTGWVQYRKLLEKGLDVNQ